MGNKIMVEVACQPYGTCDTDQLTFKAFLSRWLAVTTQLVPALAATITPYLQASAQGAAGQCDGGTDGVTCGMEWNTTTWDGTYGVGQQMSALAAIQSQMLTADTSLTAPLTSSTGGNSTSDPSAGTGGSTAISDEGSVYTRVITTGDKAGAAILTIVVLATLMGGSVWMIIS